MSQLLNLTQSRYAALVGVLLLFSMGYLLRGAPVTPDDVFDKGQLFGTYFVFFGYAFCLIQWGRWLTAKFFPGELETSYQWALIFGLGTAWGWASITLLGSIGLIHYQWMGLHLFLLILGPLLASRSSSKTSPSLHWMQWCLLTVLVLMVLGRLAKGAFPHGTTDQLMYHLLGPRMWADAGRIIITESQPRPFNCWYWEYLYIWGNTLIGGPNGGGLIASQLFNQWQHAFFGILGSAAAIFAIFYRFLNDSTQTLAVAAAAVVSLHLAPYSFLAKNDLGMFFWFLCGMALIPRSVLGAGLFLGLALGSKPNVLFIILPLGLWTLYQWVRPAPQLNWKLGLHNTLKLSGVILLILSPLFIRNWIYDANPFAPYPNWIFGTQSFGPTLMENSAHMKSQWTWNLDLFWTRIGQIIEDNPVNALALTLPLLAIGLKQLRPLTPIWGICMISFAYFLLRTFITIFFVRWYGPGLLLMAALGVTMVFLMIPKSKSWTSTASLSICGVIVIGILIHTFPTFRTISTIVTQPLGQSHIIRNEDKHKGGSSKAWLRLNTQPGDLIVSTGDSQLYYVAHLNIVNLRESKTIDEMTYNNFDPYVLLEKLTEYGARWVLDTVHWQTIDPSRPVLFGVRSQLIDMLVGLYPEAVVYRTPYSKVVDLQYLNHQVARDGKKIQPFDPTGHDIKW